MALRPVPQSVQYDRPHRSLARCIWSALGSHKVRRRVNAPLRQQRVHMGKPVQPVMDDLRKGGAMRL
jgi:hypothetical protein